MYIKNKVFLQCERCHIGVHVRATLCFGGM